MMLARYKGGNEDTYVALATGGSRPKSFSFANVEWARSMREA